jgi:two-component system, chemotaxis family, chemotaxis protein CheY
VMDGIAFRSAQLADAKMRDIPVIVLTAHADPKKTAEEMKAKAWLRKPVPLQALLDTIDEVCPPTPPS